MLWKAYILIISINRRQAVFWCSIIEYFLSPKGKMYTCPKNNCQPQAKSYRSTVLFLQVKGVCHVPTGDPSLVGRFFPLTSLSRALLLCSRDFYRSAAKVKRVRELWSSLVTAEEDFLNPILKKISFLDQELFFCHIIFILFAVLTSLLISSTGDFPWAQPESSSMSFIWSYWAFVSRHNKARPRQSAPEKRSAWKPSSEPIPIRTSIRQSLFLATDTAHHSQTIEQESSPAKAGEF